MHTLTPQSTPRGRFSAVLWQSQTGRVWVIHSSSKPEDRTSPFPNTPVRLPYADQLGWVGGSMYAHMAVPWSVWACRLTVSPWSSILCE